MRRGAGAHVGMGSGERKSELGAFVESSISKVSVTRRSGIVPSHWPDPRGSDPHLAPADADTLPPRECMLYPMQYYHLPTPVYSPMRMIPAFPAQRSRLRR